MTLETLLELIQGPRTMTHQELEGAIECIKEAIELEEFAWDAFGDDLHEAMIQWREERGS